MASGKKRASTGTKAASKGGGRGKGASAGLRRFVSFVRSERFARVRGACYILFALFALLALAGYYATDCGSRGHWLGSLGQGLADFMAVNLFGIGSLGIPFLFFIYGMRLLGVTVLPWWKSFGSTLFWMLWVSLFLGYIGGAWVKNPNYEHFAGIGIMMAEPLHEMMSWWTFVLLLFVAVLFLVLVHKMSLPEVRLPKVDLKRVAQEVERDLAEVASDHKEEQRAESEERGLEKDFIALEREEEDPGADFDEAAMELFHKPALEDEAEANADAPAPAVPQKENTPDKEPAFTIDDEFERVMMRARGTQDTEAPTPPAPAKDDNEVSFTIEESEASEQTDAPASTPPAPEADDDAPTETLDDLDPDDYRRHYGLDEPYDPHLDLSDFIMPDTDMLENWEVANVKVTKEELIANKDRIVQTLRDYGIEITEITATPGPTVTLYKIKPAPGVRISKIKSLEDDIALSLAALGIRIIAPIPGESNVGIEVPNAKPQIVSMKTMLESAAFKDDTKMELPIALGKTISNEPFVADLAKMPHLLMAGATGTGKSVGLNAVLASLLYKKHPSELKLVLVDPKKVEFSLYSALERHYLAKMPDEEEAVITDVKKVVRTLNSLCIEMDSRYDLLKQAKVRKITEYNEKFCKRMLNPEHGHRYLPYIVVVIDEFGDLIMTAGKEVELPIARLAQLARAVGIHLIIATQRPTTNIITGTIKANFPARVAFRVTSGIDSKTILDTGGAQQLIGRGDMLISLAGKDMVRLQCALIDTPEIEKLVKFIGDQRGYPDGFELPEYLDENEEPNKEFDAKHKDEFFNDAARLVVASQFGSTSLLQRKLQLGYNRAGRIIDQLEAAGIVGPSNGSKPRDVLVHDEVSLEEILKAL